MAAAGCSGGKGNRRADGVHCAAPKSLAPSDAGISLWLLPDAPVAKATVALTVCIVSGVFSLSIFQLARWCSLSIAGGSRAARRRRRGHDALRMLCRRFSCCVTASRAVIDFPVSFGVKCRCGGLPRFARQS